MKTIVVEVLIPLLIIASFGYVFLRQLPHNLNPDLQYKVGAGYGDFYR